MKKISLSGRWNLSELSGKVKNIAVTVPGDNLSALIKAGKVPHPYWGDNEQRCLWVGQRDWVFERSVRVSPAMLKEESVFLNFDSLDTLAKIYVNGKLAGQSENMFVRRRFEVKKLLKAGENRVRIEIRSAENAAVSAAKKLPYEIPYGAFPVQSPNRNLIRKVQCHGGWDWGPDLMVSGLYGESSLCAYSGARIEYVYTEQKHSKNACDVTVSCEVFSPFGGRVGIDISLAGRRVQGSVNLVRGRNLLSRKVRIKDPELWWPAGYGAQPLYGLRVQVGQDVVEKRIGLRTLELVNEKDKIGLSMYFKVNGVPVFCKGANWIPTDALPAQQSREVYEDLLSSAVAANMNMLRVWGGGQYESDVFYSLCDEKGILIWHDMMFSCALYPADEKFLENVREEISYQVKRLRDHASIALWCGNNENVGALTWFEVSRKNRDRYLVDYDRLNDGVVGKTVKECDPSRAYWPSSPCGGKNNYLDCWHNDGSGDMHFWSVWHEGKSFEAFFEVTPRFCSEFGYQSFPSLDTIKTYAPESEFNVTSPLMEYHQRNPGGNSRINEMFGRYFRIPQGFENFVYLSQVQQGLAIKTAVEYWRSLKPVCMGTLFWQLNDNWPVCSWASVEYGGKWKLLHYMAKRFFDPVLITAHRKKDGPVEVWVTSDKLKKISGKAVIEVRDFSGKVLKKFSKHIVAGAGKTALVKKAALKEFVNNPEDGFLFLSFEWRGGKVDNEFFFCEYKRCALARPAIKVKTREAKDGIIMTLTTDKPAFFVSMDLPGAKGRFSDNCFTLLPGIKKEVWYFPDKKIEPKQFNRRLKIKCLE